MSPANTPLKKSSPKLHFSNELFRLREDAAYLLKPIMHSGGIFISSEVLEVLPLGEISVLDKAHINTYKHI